jgi:hypothetical protein
MNFDEAWRSLLLATQVHEKVFLRSGNLKLEALP